MSHDLTLPRISVRSRRRKPRGPQWRRKAAWCCAFLFLMAVNLLSGDVLRAAAMAVFFAAEHHDLRRAPCDPEAKPLTLWELQVGTAVRVAALCLAVAAWLS